jgi:hypothetical protein
MGLTYSSFAHVFLFMNHLGVSKGIFRLRLAVCAVLLGLEEDVLLPSLDFDQAKQAVLPYLSTKGVSYWQSHYSPSQCLPYWSAFHFNEKICHYFVRQV